MNIRDIAAPLDKNAPCGENLRVNTSMREIYYRIKDARNQARTAERGISPGDNITLCSAWTDVSNLGLQIISSRSKDLEVLAWLAEAELRLRGFEGLRDIYLAITSLLDKYWEQLHSVGDGDLEERLAPLAGLNGVGGEGTIIQAIRLTPLVPGAKFAQFSLWDFQLSQRPNEAKRRDELNQVVMEAGVSAMRSHLEGVNGCISAFDGLVALLGERCGSEAPPSSNTHNVLREAAAAIRTLAGIDPETDASASEPKLQAANANSVAEAQPVQARPLNADAIGSREEAFELLTSVARYFRRTEPHSPISLAIETLVRRGRMDFSELLAELLPEQQVRNAVLTAAGIQPKSNKSG
ncbi:type VI secretion system protein TssA (plasmid) [Rhizobium sp. CB3060]|uniref:type VI secretion system protein TssA n=1 Tax=Rhizobium sp. CB3060 TaxID=3138255 RepID=UPI0021A73214|nr:type VI secretion system protein TssA [Rhizobium tropici]UWU25316.1 type VI secretion system protein TssA [Rhizobium tropici]